MADTGQLVVLRVEVTGSESFSSGGGDRQNIASTTPGTLLLTGRDNIDNKQNIKREKFEVDAKLLLGLMNGDISDVGETRDERYIRRRASGTLLGTGFRTSNPLTTTRAATNLYLRNISTPTKEQLLKGAKTASSAASAASAAYTIYSQHKTIGYNLSGASHAAAKQQNKAQVGAFATGIGISLATGQLWATAMLIGGRALQLAQTNRQEIYRIRSSQVISTIMQERLIKDTIQRRF